MAVFRHPLFNNVAAEFDGAVGTEITGSFGKGYSRYYRLVRLAKLPAIIREPAVWVSWLFETTVLKNKIPGPFCSELVARVYRRLRLPLFANNKSPRDVTPHDLAESELKPVADAVIDLKSESDVVCAITFGDEPAIDFDTDAFAENVRDVRLIYRRIKTLQRQMDAELRRIRASQDGLLLSTFLQQIALLKSLSRKIEAASKKNSFPSANAHRRRAEELRRTVTLLFPMCKRISDGEELAARELPEFYARYTVFSKSLAYSIMLYESSRLRFESRQRRGWTTSLSHYLLKRKRAKVLRQARRWSKLNSNANLSLNPQRSSNR